MLPYKMAEYVLPTVYRSMSKINPDLGNYDCRSKGIPYNGQVLDIAQHAKG